MKRYFSYLTHIIVLLFLFNLMFIPTAHAYIDPGTGSYVLQMIIAGLLGGAYVIKIYWIRVKMFFVNIFSKKGDQDDN